MMNPWLLICCAIIMLSLSGCATPPAPQRVPIPCVDAADLPAWPSLQFEALPDGLSADTYQRAIIRDHEALRQYAREASALLAGCVR